MHRGVLVGKLLYIPKSLETSLQDSGTHRLLWIPMSWVRYQNFVDGLLVVFADILRALFGSEASCKQEGMTSNPS